MSSSRHSHAGSGKFPGNCSLEQALDTIVGVFHQYSAREGQMDLLSPGDFSTLLREQAPAFLGTCERSRAGYLEQLFQESDLSGDKELSFEEFSTVLGKLADDAHRLSHGHERCGPDSD